MDPGEASEQHHLSEMYDPPPEDSQQEQQHPPPTMNSRTGKLETIQESNEELDLLDLDSTPRNNDLMLSEVGQETMTDSQLAHWFREEYGAPVSSPNLLDLNRQSPAITSIDSPSTPSGFLPDNDSPYPNPLQALNEQSQQQVQWEPSKTPKTPMTPMNSPNENQLIDQPVAWDNQNCIASGALMTQASFYGHPGQLPQHFQQMPQPIPPSQVLSPPLNSSQSGQPISIAPNGSLTPPWTVEDGPSPTKHPPRHSGRTGQQNSESMESNPLNTPPYEASDQPNGPQQAPSQGQPQQTINGFQSDWQNPPPGIPLRYPSGKLIGHRHGNQEQQYEQNYGPPGIQVGQLNGNQQAHPGYGYQNGPPGIPTQVSSPPVDGQAMQYCQQLGDQYGPPGIPSAQTQQFNGQHSSNYPTEQGQPVYQEFGHQYGPPGIQTQASPVNEQQLPSYTPERGQQVYQRGGFNGPQQNYPTGPPGLVPDQVQPSQVDGQQQVWYGQVQQRRTPGFGPIRAHCKELVQKRGQQPYAIAKQSKGYVSQYEQQLPSYTPEQCQPARQPEGFNGPQQQYPTGPPGLVPDQVQPSQVGGVQQAQAWQGQDQQRSTPGSGQLYSSSGNPQMQPQVPTQVNEQPVNHGQQLDYQYGPPPGFLPIKVESSPVYGQEQAWQGGVQQCSPPGFGAIRAHSKQLVQKRGQRPYVSRKRTNQAPPNHPQGFVNQSTHPGQNPNQNQLVYQSKLPTQDSPGFDPNDSPMYWQWNPANQASQQALSPQYLTSGTEALHQQPGPGPVLKRCSENQGYPLQVFHNVPLKRSPVYQQLSPILPISGIVPEGSSPKQEGHESRGSGQLGHQPYDYTYQSMEWSSCSEEQTGGADVKISISSPDTPSSQSSTQEAQELLKEGESLSPDGSEDTGYRLLEPNEMGQFGKLGEGDAYAEYARNLNPSKPFDESDSISDDSSSSSSPEPVKRNRKSENPRQKRTAEQKKERRREKNAKDSTKSRKKKIADRLTAQVEAASSLAQVKAQHAIIEEFEGNIRFVEEILQLLGHPFDFYAAWFQEKKQYLVGKEAIRKKMEEWRDEKRRKAKENYALATAKFNKDAQDYEDETNKGRDMNESLRSTIGSRKSRALKAMELRQYQYEILVNEHNLRRDRHLTKLAELHFQRTIPQHLHLIQNVPDAVLQVLYQNGSMPKLDELRGFVEAKWDLLEM